MKIEVIGPGCKNCKVLFELTKEVVKELDINDTVLYSTDINKIVAMGIMSTPVLAIEDKPVLVGMIPNKDQLKEIISKNISNKSTDKEILENKKSSCSCGGNC